MSNQEALTAEERLRLTEIEILGGLSEQEWQEWPESVRNDLIDKDAVIVGRFSDDSPVFYEVNMDNPMVAALFEEADHEPAPSPG